MIAAVNRVPIEWSPQLLAEQTPFSTALRIRDAMRRATSRVHLFDRYLDASVFELYVRELDRAIEIRLVTTHGRPDFGVENLLTLSRLAASEFRNYQLIECTSADMHDRNLRVDDQVFSLGPSVKDAGKRPTNFLLGDCSPAGHQLLDDILAKGKLIS